MSLAQPGILAEPPRQALYLYYNLKPEASPANALRALADLADGDRIVVGLGQALVQAVGASIDGLRNFPAHAAGGVSVPSTPAMLWIWLRGEELGDLLHEALRIDQLLADNFVCAHRIEAFQYRDSRDLTGYEDGTENPTGKDAVDAALVQQTGDGLDGSSFLAVQQWVHDLQHFEDMPQQQQDNTIGRRLSDNEELDDAPASAHVKRTAQEDFDPEAFVLRRSMPWSGNGQAGLVFSAFGKSFDAFEALLNRMVGLDDGITDSLFTFTHPVTGGYYWCPPMRDGNLDLTAVNL